MKHANFIKDHLLPKKSTVSVILKFSESLKVLKSKQHTYLINQN